MIKEILIIFAIVLAAIVSLTFLVHAGEQSRFYDSRGNSVGTATRDSQGTTTFRDSRGNITGKEYRR